MSDILLPDGSRADCDEPPARKVIGRRLKRPEELFDLFGQLLYLRNQEAAKNIPVLKKNGYAGLIQCVTPDPAYPARAGAVWVFSGAIAGQAFEIPTDILEKSDPWCRPPGSDVFVSLLE